MDKITYKEFNEYTLCTDDVQRAIFQLIKTQAHIILHAKLKWKHALEFGDNGRVWIKSKLTQNQIDKINQKALELFCGDYNADFLLAYSSIKQKQFQG